MVRYNGAVDSAADELTRLVERLITALGAQVAAGVTGELALPALDALADLTRLEAREFFGHAGHLVHYDDAPGVERLSELVAASMREQNVASEWMRPGDRVRLVGAIPLDLAETSEDWLRATTFVVRFVGEDQTVDIQPDFHEDYVVMTVPAASVTAIA
jgi:hypothetical protein